MVAHDVIPFGLTHGNRAKIVALNVVRLRRRGLSREALSALKSAYRTLFHSGLGLAEAIAKIEQAPRSPEIDNFLSFLRGKSSRGLCRPSVHSDGDEAVESLA